MTTPSHQFAPYIVYADDDIDDQLLFQQVMQQEFPAATVRLMENGAALLEQLSHSDHEDAAHLPCLIVLDINMPRLNGLDTLQLLRLRPAFSDVPVVLFSTSGIEKERALGAGATAFYNKAYSLTEMRRICRSMISYCHPTVAAGE